MKNIPMLTRIFVAAAALSCAFPVAAQEMLTADQFFRQISERYAAIKDYQADLAVKAGKNEMAGSVIFKSPNLMRMDFSKPASQVMVYNGSNFLIYVPGYNAILVQETSGGTASAAAVASGEGLRMMGRNYIVGYEKGPVAENLPGSESEKVVRLILTRRTVAEGFRTITLSIDPTRKLIRRMEGISHGGDLVIFDFTNIRLDAGIADTKFIYDAPASANTFNNFLFSNGK